MQPLLTTAIAGGTVGAVALRPRSARAASVAAALAVSEIAGGAAGADAIERAVRAAGPALVFLTAAIMLARVAERSGLVELAAAGLARAGGGRRPALLVL